MSLKRKRANQKGPPFIQLHHWMVDSRAWGSLTPNARCVYQALKRFYNGLNNGSISFSARQAGDCLNASHHTGNRALAELVAAGFIVVTEESDFNRKVHVARSYLLTEAADDRPGVSRTPLKKFMRASENSKVSLMGEQHSRVDATVGGKGHGEPRQQSHIRDCDDDKRSNDSRVDATHIDSSHPTQRGAQRAPSTQASAARAPDLSPALPPANLQRPSPLARSLIRSGVGRG